MSRWAGAALLLSSAFMVLPAGSASAVPICLGTCGASGADGDVGLSPGAVAPHQYQWISTDQGLLGVGQLPASHGFNGSQFTTDSFSAIAGDTLSFYFNYVTSDGDFGDAGDYAWAQLETALGVPVVTLFTVGNVGAGDASPAPGFLANAALLTPTATPISNAEPNWSPLGADTGTCFWGVFGCGLTDWIKASYTIGSSGDYRLAFGVTNGLDDFSNSGLAFDQIQVAVPEPATWPMVLFGLPDWAFWRRGHGSGKRVDALGHERALGLDIDRVDRG